MAGSVIGKPEMYDLTGDFFSEFNLQVEKVIDEGMCGDIVLAIPLDKKEERHVVKKFSLLTEDDSARNMDLFHTEIRFMQSFDHPFVMKCLFAGRCPGYLAHCTNYYRRGTLDCYVGDLSPELSELCVTQVSCALRYLHKHHVVHLDVKLDNIFLDDDSNAILGDFGLAIELSPDQKTVCDEKCGGTPCYFAPERIGAADDKELDPYKLDSYCLGVVMWELFLEKDADDGINYYHEARRKRDLPAHFRGWLLKLLDRNPSKRPTVTYFLKRMRLEGSCPYVIDNN